MEDGKKLDARVRVYSRARRSLFVDSTLTATAYKPGTFDLIAIGGGARKNFKLTVNYPPITEVKVDAIPQKIYAGTPVALKFKVLDKAGLVREDVAVEFSSANEKVAVIDEFGTITTLTPGKATIKAKAENVVNTISLNVVKNPITKIELTADGDGARTGDVFHFKAKALDSKGKEVADAPIYFSFSGKADDVSSSASGLIKPDGRFVADEAGFYTVTASCGVASASKTLRIERREVSRKIELVGHGSVNDKHTSDLWVWEGQDGRRLYCYRYLGC